MERVRTALQRLRGKTGFVVAVVLVASSTRGADVPNTRQLPLLARAAETVGVRRCVAALAAVAARTSGTALHQDVILDWDTGRHPVPDRLTEGLVAVSEAPLELSRDCVVVPTVGALIDEQREEQPARGCDVRSEQPEHGAVAGGR